MAKSPEIAERLIARAAKGDVPAILVTRFEADAGEDLFARDALVKAIEAAVLGPEADPFGRTVLDAPNLALIEVLDAAREVSLMAPRRLVLVRGSRIAASGSGSEDGDGENAGAAGAPKDADGAQIAALGRYLERAAASACILFVGSPWDARRRVHKALLEAATVVDLSRPDQRTIPAFIRARAAEAGVRFEGGAVEALAELRGNDTLRIAAEVAKLRDFAGPTGTVTRQDVLALSSSAEAPSAWTMVDAMADGDADGALRALRQLIDDGEAAPVIVGAIASRLRQMIVVRDEQAAGRSNDAARRIVFPGRSIVFADALARKTARFTPAALVTALADLYDVDKLCKSSALPAGAHLERWMASVLGRADVVHQAP